MSELMKKLEATTISAWNASVTMGQVADDCKVKKGESLYDRVEKCEARLKEWDYWLKDLEKEIPALVKVIEPETGKQGDPNRVARVTAELIEGQLESMRKSYQRVRKEFDGYKAILRKIKVK